MTTRNAAYLTELHQLLNQHFNLEEIRTLYFHLNMDYESVSGEEKPSRIREMLLALGRRGRLPELVTLAQQERSFVVWPPVPDDFQLPESLAASETAVPADQYRVYGDVVQGDKVEGDKVDGDKISVGDISDSAGIAIGRGARANVHIQPGLGTNHLNQLFAPLLAEVAQYDPSTLAKVQSLKAEVGRGEEANDEKMADLISDIADAVPSVIEELVDLFNNSLVDKAVGGATKYVLKKIRM